MDELKFKCPKCSSIEYEIGEIRTTGGFLSKVFDVQNKKFTFTKRRSSKFT